MGSSRSPSRASAWPNTFADPKAPTRHTTQYFEIFGNRAIYHDGWLAGTVHRAAWEFKVRRPLADDIWELYDTRTDFSLANDLAANNPGKLKELQDLFLKEAVKYSVLPLDDRLQERFVAALVGRPDLMAGRTSLTVHQGMTGMSENIFHRREEQVTHDHRRSGDPEAGGQRSPAGPGGRFGGWSLYIKDGKPTYTYNWLGLERYTVSAKQALPAGKATIRFEFAYDGGGLGKGGTGHALCQREEGRRGSDRKNAIRDLLGGRRGGRRRGRGHAGHRVLQGAVQVTGTIASVTIDLKDVKAAEHEETEHAQKTARLKKALAD